MFKCSPCAASFRTHDDLMDHMSEIHLTESQRQGDGLKKYMTSSGSRRESGPPPCRNGDQCSYHRQRRCNFYHASSPQEKQGRPPRQAPSQQWQQKQSWRPHSYKENRGQEAQQQRTQGSINTGAQRSSTTWCKHVHNCLQGRFCVLRNEADQDFNNLPAQTRK